MNNKRTLTSILLIAGILLFVNFLAKDYPFRLDLTEGKIYTLSQATNDVLEGLEEPVTITAYFTGSLPSQYAKTLRDFQDLLKEYAARSGGMLNYELVDPNADETKKQEALQNGIQPLLINVREKDAVAQKEAFMGAILKAGDRQEIVPFVQPEGPMEYQMTTAVKKISMLDKPSVGLIQGHGEAGLQDIPMAAEAMSVLYNVEPLDLSSETAIPERFKTLILLRPTDSIPPPHFAMLDDYLIKGGALCVAFNTVEGDFQSVQGRAVNTGVAEWLGQKGLEVSTEFLLDASCGAISVQQRQGMFSFASQVEFPYFPLVSNFLDHPVTSGLDQVIFQFASPIRFAPRDTNLHYQPLLQTSEQSGIAGVPLYFDIQKRWTAADFPNGPQTIGAVLEGDFGGNGQNGRLVVMSDGDFPLGAPGRGSNSDNVSLLVNSVDWLADDTGLIDLRTKMVASRPIEELEDGRRTFLKWLNFGLPLLLVIGYSIFRFQRNQQIRLRRMQERYS